MAAAHHPKHEIVRHGKPAPLHLEEIDSAYLKLAAKRAAERGTKLSQYATELFLKGFAEDLIADELGKPLPDLPHMTACETTP